MDFLESAGEHLSVADVCIALGMCDLHVLPRAYLRLTKLCPRAWGTDSDPAPYIPYLNVLSLSVSTSRSFSEDPDAADLGMRLHLPSVHLTLDSDESAQTSSAEDHLLDGEQLRRTLCEPGSLRSLRRRTAERFLNWRRQLSQEAAEAHEGASLAQVDESHTPTSSHLSPLLPSIDDPLHLPSLLRMGLGLVSCWIPESGPSESPHIPGWLWKAAAVTVSVVAVFGLGWMGSFMDYGSVAEHARVILDMRMS
jgi:hypothetical protein